MYPVLSSPTLEENQTFPSLAKRLECVRLAGAFGRWRGFGNGKREQAPRTPNAGASSDMPLAKECAKRLECVRLAGAFGRWRGLDNAKAGASSAHSKRWREFRHALGKRMREAFGVRPACRRF